MKATKRKAGVVGVFVLTLVLVACLDPINLIPEYLPIQGDINFTDVTAGAFVITNLSRTIQVTEITVAHPDYGSQLRLFNGVPRPVTSKAIFVNASEDNYAFEVKWAVDGKTGTISRELTMPQSRAVRYYFLFMLENGEVVLVDTEEEVKQREYNKSDTEVNLSVIIRDPAIELIVQQLFNANNSGWLTIRNRSVRSLQGISIQPSPKDTNLVRDMSQAELSYIDSWRASLQSRYPGVDELPTTGVRLRAGDYMVLFEGNMIAEVSVLPQSNMSNFAETNRVTINDDLFDGVGLLPTTPLLNEIRATMFGSRSPFYWSASSYTNPNYWRNIPIGSVVSPGVILVGPGSIDERQAIVNASRAADPAGYFTHGTGVEVTTAGITQNSVRKISNDDAWFQYRILSQFNNGKELIIRIVL